MTYVLLGFFGILLIYFLICDELLHFGFIFFPYFAVP